ncbi:fumarylacetoacetate hydrolase family protein [Aestuariibius sp. HNIBRBA575]|uniref:fumarylacetoacetate hydrolase family protein n=1 Tax=Aestuariibius sp. HNIBRBA575 TaxID=3233343 RepID=UPI0034A2573F
MKLARYGPRNAPKTPCILDQDDAPRNASSLVDDFGPNSLSPDLITKLQSVDPMTLPLMDVSDMRLAPPISQPKNIWCIGLNYSDHAAEAGMDIPQEPILFNKSSGTFCGPNDDILFSPKMTKLDWEVELGIVIGKPALNISKSEAMDHVAGFVLVNDLSERAWQLERSGQWVKGKSFPNFCPTGPFLITPDAVGDVQSLGMWLDVNGQRMQTGNTGTMIFDVETIVSYMSEFTRLEPGDLICTGTPPGVGAGMDPQTWLQVGDQVSLGIDGLGEQSQTVVAL